MLVRVGVILGPRGLKVHFKVKSFTKEPCDLSAYGPVVLDNGQTLRLSVLATKANRVVIVKADGLASREDVEGLRGRTIKIQRESLPELEQDEFYHVDLIGATVINLRGNDIGKVVALHNFGAGDIVEVKPEAGPTVMLPLEANI